MRLSGIDDSFARRKMAQIGDMAVSLIHACQYMMIVMLQHGGVGIDLCQACLSIPWDGVCEPVYSHRGPRHSFADRSGFLTPRVAWDQTLLCSTKRRSEQLNVVNRSGIGRNNHPMPTKRCIIRGLGVENRPSDNLLCPECQL